MPITFLVDENVPESVAEFLRGRGHTVYHVRDLCLAGSPDPIIAAAGDRLDAVVVTWNHRDFKKIVSRIPPKGQATLRKLGRVTFRCDEAQGRRRAETVIDVIEDEHRRAQQRGDKRLMLQVTATTVSLII